MRFGFHVSAAGGFKKAAERAVRLGCETVQLFAQNPRAWSVKDIESDDALSCRSLLSESGIMPLSVHMPYLPNPASGNAGLYDRTLNALCANLIRADVLDARYLVVHPGNSGTDASHTGIKRAAFWIAEACRRVVNTVTILLENTSGQGSEIGCDFKQLAEILECIGAGSRCGICFDTAHAYAAGYDLSTADAVDKTIGEFDTLLGLSRLKLIHLNDTLMTMGSCKDRHWHIGRGKIGMDGFAALVNHPLLQDLPAVMETPKKREDDDSMNLSTVRRLAGR